MPSCSRKSRTKAEPRWRLDDQDQVGAALGRVAGADRAAMRQCHLAGKAQADAAAALVGRVERQKDVVPAILGNARTIVPDLDAGLAAAQARDDEADQRLLGLRRGADGVA